ncbi:hypothetical protein BCS42_07735 [Crenothrix sp. D3]|nr:hypothetical protein BCS42_07735 [Crenothrix sp. D3]
MEYQKFNLGTWVSNQRVNKDKLDLEKIQKLELLSQWSWSVFEDQWNEGFGYLKSYVEKYGHARVPRGFKCDGFNLDLWVCGQRKVRNKLDLEKIKKLESLPKWSWNALEDKWNDGFCYLKKYIEEHGNAKVPNRFKYENFNIGAWVGVQRYTKDNLDLEKIKKLESLSEWSWNPLEEQWNKGFEYLKKYVSEEGNARVPLRFKYENFNLGSWVSHQKQNREQIDLEKIKKLELLPQWVWNVLEDQWNEGFEYLKKYVEEYGDARVPNQFKYKDFKLGGWVSTQRNEKNKMSQEKIQLLESLPQWSWNILEDKWNKGLEYLKKYVEENGHSRVPIRFKYEDFNLGSWVSNQKINNKNKILDLEKIKKLESLPQWSWSIKPK